MTFHKFKMCTSASMFTKIGRHFTPMFYNCSNEKMQPNSKLFDGPTRRIKVNFSKLYLFTLHLRHHSQRFRQERSRSSIEPYWGHA